VFSWLLGVLTKEKIDRKRVIPIFCGANLYKYLPGNFMHFVGRNRIAAETDGVSHGKVAAATIIDSASLCVAAVVIAAISVLDYFVAHLRQFEISPFIFIGAGVIILLIALSGFFFRSRFALIVGKIKIALKGLTPKIAAKMFVAACIRLLILASAYLLILILFGQEMTLAIVPQVIGLFALAWVIGFIMPGAPGGLGVREAIMITFLGDTLSQDIVLSATIIHRVVCIFGDLSAYAAALIYSKKRGKLNNEKEN